MINSFRALAKARRLMRSGRPLAAALALQKIAIPKLERAKRVAKPTTRIMQLSQPRPAPGTFIEGRYASPTGTLTYKLYTPTGSTRRSLPIVVMLHGCGQSADDFARGTKMNALADELGFLVLYPEQSSSANLGRCWNWHRPGDQARGSGEPATIAALTRQVASTTRANLARVYIGGLSAGAAAAAITAAAYPELFVAVGAHSGAAHAGVATVGGALSAMRSGTLGSSLAKTRAPPPTIVFHGDADTVVHPGNAGGFLKHLRRSTSKLLISRATTGRSEGGRDYTRTTHRLGNEPVILEEWVVHQSGHAWAGGSRRGSDTDPAGPDASREMMRFFLARKQHRPIAGRRSDQKRIATVPA